VHKPACATTDLYALDHYYNCTIFGRKADDMDKSLNWAYLTHYLWAWELFC